MDTARRRHVPASPEDGQSPEEGQDEAVGPAMDEGARRLLDASNTDRRNMAGRREIKVTNTNIVGTNFRFGKNTVQTIAPETENIPPAAKDTVQYLKDTTPGQRIRQWLLKRWWRWVLLCLIVWISVVQWIYHYEEVHQAPSIAAITRASWYKDHLPDHSISQGESNDIPLKPTLESHIFTDLQSIVKESTPSIQEALLLKIQEFEGVDRELSNRYQAFHWSFVSYNTTWPYYLRSLHEAVQKEEEAHSRIGNWLWNMFLRVVWPWRIITLDVKLGYIVQRHVQTVILDLEPIGAHAQEYQDQLISWQEQVTDLRRDLGVILLEKVNRKKEIVHRGISGTERKVVDEMIENLQQLNRQTCNASRTVKETRVTSDKACKALKSMSNDLGGWLRECELGRKCEGGLPKLQGMQNIFGKIIY